MIRTSETALSGVAGRIKNLTFHFEKCQSFIDFFQYINESVLSRKKTHSIPKLDIIESYIDFFLNKRSWAKT
jgi:hypothetical protein